MHVKRNIKKTENMIKNTKKRGRRNYQHYQL